jgi:hypothetical protein
MKFTKLQSSINFDGSKVENTLTQSGYSLLADIDNKFIEIATVSTYRLNSGTENETRYAHIYINHNGIIVSLRGSVDGFNYDTALESALQNPDIEYNGKLITIKATLEAVAEFFNIEHFKINVIDYGFFTY